MKTDLDISFIGETKEKILDIRALPTYNELLRYISWSSDYFERIDEISDISYELASDRIENFCIKNGIYLIPNVEFIDTLSSQIKSLDKQPILEIFAGNGKLSYHLREKGIDIHATDDYSWNAGGRKKEFVENMSYKDALKKYQPRIVVCSWMPDDISIDDILNCKSIDYFIDIERGGIEIKPKTHDFKLRHLPGVEIYTISAMSTKHDLRSSVVLLDTHEKQS